MAYEKQNWKCGDIVSAEKLNHIEDGIAECCSEKGYECTEEWTTLTEENVTTQDGGGGLYETSLEYHELITADSVRITLNGVEYTCTNISEESDEGAYGAEIPDWSTYPFRLESLESSFGGGAINHITTETAGTYSVKIEAVEESVETSDCFKKAVKSVVNIPNIAIIYSSQLGTPSVDGVSRNNIAYTDCGDGTRGNVNMYLWDGMDSYNGEPIIYVAEDEPGNNFYFVSSFEQLELCAYDKEEDATGRNLGLKERTRVLRLNGADGVKTLVSPNTQFYKYYLK